MSERTATLPARRVAPATRSRLSKTEAQALTQQIRENSQHLWVLVVEAHDRGAWKVLGYDSWRAYARAELGISESRSYQLIDAGRVQRSLATSLGSGTDSSTLEMIPVLTQRQVARAKPVLPTLRKEFSRMVKEGKRPDEALAQALRAIPTPIRDPRTSEGPSMARHPAGKALLPENTQKCPLCGGRGYVDAT